MEHAVVCRRVPGYEAGVDEAVEAVFAACPRAAALGPGTKALIKPNLLAKHAPQAAVTTHPAVVAACIRALQARGVADITVADSGGGRYTPAGMAAVYEACGAAAVCRALGAKLYTGCRALPKSTDGALVREFELIEPVHEADFIVNVPKLKTHVMMGMTCAVKNLFGTVPGLRKAELHMRFPEKERFAQMLVDLWGAVRPDVTVVDGIVAMEGDGPAGGTPRALGVVLGGCDPFAVDLAVCRMLGLAPAAVPYLARAQAGGLCPASLDEAWLCGQPEAAAPVKGFCLPQSFVGVDFAQKAPRALRWAVPGVEKWLAPRPKIRRAACIGCGKCAEICPGHTVRLRQGKARIDPAGCIRCFCCHEMCPVKAIDIKRSALFRL